MRIQRNVQLVGILGLWGVLLSTPGPATAEPPEPQQGPADVIGTARSPAQADAEHAAAQREVEAMQVRIEAADGPWGPYGAVPVIAPAAGTTQPAAGEAAVRALPPFGDLLLQKINAALPDALKDAAGPQPGAAGSRDVAQPEAGHGPVVVDGPVDVAFEAKPDNEAAWDPKTFEFSPGNAVTVDASSQQLRIEASGTTLSVGNNSSLIDLKRGGAWLRVDAQGHVTRGGENPSLEPDKELLPTDQQGTLRVVDSADNTVIKIPYGEFAKIHTKIVQPGNPAVDIYWWPPLETAPRGLNMLRVLHRNTISVGGYTHVKFSREDGNVSIEVSTLHRMLGFNVQESISVKRNWDGTIDILARGMNYTIDGSTGPFSFSIAEGIDGPLGFVIYPNGAVVIISVEDTEDIVSGSKSKPKKK